MTQSLLNRVPVIPVVVVDDVDHAVPIARALVAGGLPVIELTLRTPVALTAIERIAGEVPEIFLGAGTIVEPSQAKQAASAGAQFLVSPGSTPTLLQAMTDSGLPAPARCGNGFGDPDRARSRIHRIEVLPGRGRRRGQLPQVGQFTDPGGELLPDRRHRHHQRPPVSGLAERRLRRRLLDHAVRCCRQRQLGTHHRTGSRRRDALTPAPTRI